MIAHADRIAALTLISGLGCAATTAGVATRGPAEPVITRPEVPAVQGREEVPAAPSHTDGDVRMTFVAPSGRTEVLTWRHRARSVGGPTRGSLRDAQCLPESGPGFIAFSENRCATDETIRLLLFAIGEVMREYPSSPPVVIGALSRPTGGRLKPHKSHRSGRDVDIGYFAVKDRPMRTFTDLSRDEIDYDKTFYLMAALIATGRVDFLFVNYALQPRFVEAARRLGYDDEQISYLFQYPRGRGSRTGLIRHARGHLRHFHVRFACPRGDGECVPD